MTEDMFSPDFIAHADQVDAEVTDMLRPLVRGLLKVQESTTPEEAGEYGDRAAMELAPMLFEKDSRELAELLFSALSRLAALSVQRWQEEHPDER